MYRQINKIFVCAACFSSLALTVHSAHAQQTRAQARQEQRIATANAAAARRFDRINTLLAQINLTPDQKARVAALQADAQGRIAPLLLDRTLTPTARKDQIRVLTQGALLQTRTLLGPLQKRRLSALARRAREQLEGAKAVNAAGNTASVSPTVVTADGEEVQF